MCLGSAAAAALVAQGERLLKDLYEALRAGKGWDKTLFMVTYDDAGGFEDQVRRPAAVQDHSPCLVWNGQHNVSIDAPTDCAHRSANFSTLGNRCGRPAGAAAVFQRTTTGSNTPAAAAPLDLRRGRCIMLVRQEPVFGKITIAFYETLALRNPGVFQGCLCDDVAMGREAGRQRKRNSPALFERGSL